MTRLELKKCTVLNIATDVVAFNVVPKLPRSTSFHHVTTCTLMMAIWSSVQWI